MRQGQQNHRRGRGRGRKSHNPLARVHESNGPDVKIRGTASHIAEKYMALARDATSSGDLVMAENYLQHAEHYNRIIMLAQAQARAEDPNGMQQGMRRGFDPTSLSGDGDQGGYDWDDEQDGGDQPPMEQGYAEPHQQPPQQPQPAHSRRHQEQQPRFQDQPRINELPAFVERPVFAGDRQAGGEPSQSRSYEPRPPRHHDQDGGRFEPREGAGRDGGRGEHRGPRRRGRHDNGGRQRMHPQDRQGGHEARGPDVNGASYAEPAPRDTPEPSDAD
jgi:hypothetical protein